MAYTYKDVCENSPYNIDYCPTKFADLHILVIPVWFTDSSNYISVAKKEDVRDDIEKVYFGDPDEIGWHSVRSFYEQESLDSIFFEGEATPWYECGKSSTEFYSESSGKEATLQLVQDAVDWYFGDDTASRLEYDSDQNGFLDAVHLIYAAPDYQCLRNGEAGNLWAYSFWLQKTSLKKPASPGPNQFFWASYDFIYGRNALTRTGHQYANGDTDYCTLDSHTFIHEMGHVFGLDDYYDYVRMYLNPAGAFSMQDHNVGGHDPYSVLAFGWCDPYIPTDSCSLKIRPFQETHDLILLTPEWNDYDSPFDEYLLLELYTPTGLNQHDCEHKYDSYPKGPNATGIRLWHVDARLTHCEGARKDGTPIWSEDLVTYPDYPSRYGVRTAMTNTCEGASYGSPLGEDYYIYDLLHMIRNSESEPLQTDSFLNSTHLFKNGDSFAMSDFSSQFPEGDLLDSGRDLGWTFNVEIEGENESAIATINLTRTN